MPTVLTLTPAQYAAVVAGQREGLVHDIHRQIAQRAFGHRVVAIAVETVRDWLGEADAAGVIAPVDVRDLCHLFADMHWAGGRPPEAAARLADPAVAGRLKVFQVRCTFAGRRLARAA